MPPLTPYQHKLLEVLRRGEMTARDLAELIYASDPDGGPLWPEEVVRVQIHRMRRKGVLLRHMGQGRGYAVAEQSETTTSKG